MPTRLKSPASHRRLLLRLRHAIKPTGHAVLDRDIPIHDHVHFSAFAETFYVIAGCFPLT
jgi:hypothetical protein